MAISLNWFVTVGIYLVVIGALCEGILFSNCVHFVGIYLLYLIRNLRNCSNTKISAESPNFKSTFNSVSRSKFRKWSLLQASIFDGILL